MGEIGGRVYTVGFVVRWIWEAVGEGDRIPESCKN